MASSWSLCLEDAWVVVVGGKGRLLVLQASEAAPVDRLGRDLHRFRPKSCKPRPYINQCWPLFSKAKIGLGKAEAYMI